MTFTGKYNDRQDRTARTKQSG
jgi:hypothetical protein